ncbi:MAG TPA: DUF4058 family protein [Planctomycetaceae bacterium]|nr:DUF4058 family protein [Planctomycetaceae bacterium]
MPSPFPGMDPFLESPDHFPDFHHQFIAELKAAIQPLLPEPYFAKTGERVWVELSERPIIPDVSVSRADRHDESEGGVSVAACTRAEPLVLTVEPLPEEEFRETFLEIYTRSGDRKRLVASVEVLNPSNKSGTGDGRALYLRKQHETLRHDVHVIEIDLLRGGVHTTAVPAEPLRQAAGEFDYHVSLHLFTDRRRFYVWPFRLADRLPDLPVPLLPGDRPVVVDLQTVFGQAYDAGSYRREIDYTRGAPDPPLTATQAQWMRAWLASRPSGK